jgi:hypothetical protein
MRGFFPFDKLRVRMTAKATATAKTTADSSASLRNDNKKGG